MGDDAKAPEGPAEETTGLAGEAPPSVAETATEGAAGKAEKGASSTKRRAASEEEMEEEDREPKRRKRETVDEDFARGVGFPTRRPRARPFMHGWFLETHERVFNAVLTKEEAKQPRVILELGSWYGASTRWLAEHAPGPPNGSELSHQAKIYAVDLWREDFILDAQRDHYSTMGDRKLVQILRDHPLRDTFVANLWEHRDRVVPLCMTTEAGVRHVAALGVQPDVIYIDADHHYEPCKKDIQLCLDAFPDATLVGDDYGHYDDVKRAVTEMARKYNKTIHVDQNHCWTYATIDSITGRNFTPKPDKKSSFASLLAHFR